MATRPNGGVQEFDMSESTIEHVLGWISIVSVGLLFGGVALYVAISALRTRGKKPNASQ